jgi:hypothetical protein
MRHCDFCDAPNPKWCYDAVDTLIDIRESPYVHESIGGWAACDACANAIDANDRDVLIARSYEAWRARGLPTAEVLHVLRLIHSAFWFSKRGGRQRLP